jgi:hypothetical protein
MRAFHGKTLRWKEMSSGGTFEHLEFRDCFFNNCSVSRTTEVERRTVVRNISVTDCREMGCQVGPVILEDVTVHNLLIADLLILWCPAFKHVTLKGRLGSIKVNDVPDSGPFTRETLGAAFAAAQRDFYAKVDWALDIREADPILLQLEGVPADLVRRNPETQGVVRRKRASKRGWRRKVSKDCDYWLPYIDNLVGSDHPDTVLVTPTRRRSATVKSILAGLRELRELGVVDTDDGSPAASLAPMLTPPMKLTGLEPALPVKKRTSRKKTDR